MAMYVIEHLQRNEFNYLTMSEYMKMSRVDVVISVYWIKFVYLIWSVNLTF